MGIGSSPGEAEVNTRRVAGHPDPVDLAKKNCMQHGFVGVRINSKPYAILNGSFGRIVYTTEDDGNGRDWEWQPVTL